MTKPIQKKPNLFDYATSELSQDAFLCWLIAWSKPSNKEFDTDLNACAINFIQKLIGKEVEIKSVVVNRQWHQIDVTALINDKYFILIEDKTGSKEHSDQLRRYSKIAEDHYKKTDIELVLVYFKMEEQGKYTNIDNSGFSRFSRTQMLEILKSYFDTTAETNQNAIIVDFYKKITWLDTTINAYENLPLEKWGWYQWQGFYSSLQNHINGNWDYVANASGGFLGFYWHWKHFNLNGKEFEFYLQLEQDKFVFKLCVYEEINRREIRDFYRKILFKQAKKHSIDIVHFGRIGKYMSVAILPNQYRITDLDGTLNLDKTIGNLNKIMLLIDDTTREITQCNTSINAIADK